MVPGRVGVGGNLAPLGTAGTNQYIVRKLVGQSHAWRECKIARRVNRPA